VSLSIANHRKTGQRMMSVGTRREYLRRSSSRLSLRSRSISCAGPVKPVCRVAWCCSTPDMATILGCARRSRR
jgi:hypothetical protein